MMSGDANSINIGCHETKVDLEKDISEIEGIGSPGEEMGHLEESSGTKAEEDAKINMNDAAAKADAKPYCEADHVNNGEDYAEEQSALLSHLENSGGTKAEEETKFSSNSATAEAEGEADCEAYGVKNGEKMEISHAEQAVISQQFVPEEVSEIL